MYSLATCFEDLQTKGSEFRVRRKQGKMKICSVTVENPVGYTDRLKDLTLQGEIIFKRTLKK